MSTQQPQQRGTPGTRPRQPSFQRGNFRGGKYPNSSTSAAQPASASHSSTSQSTPAPQAPMEPFMMHNHDRTLFLLMHLVGQLVSVTVRDGTRYEGLFHGACTEEDLGVVLKYAKKVAPKEEAHVAKTLVIMPKDLVLMEAKRIHLKQQTLHSAPKTMAAPQAERPSTTGHAKGTAGFKTDAAIAAERAMSVATPERSLRKWADYDDNENLFELDDEDWLQGGTNATGGQWDQFAANEQLFGVRTNYQEEIYTTRLDKNDPSFKEKEKEADRIAKEILKQNATNIHVLEERGVAAAAEMDEEDRYGAVIRDAGAVGSWRAKAAPVAPTPLPAMGRKPSNAAPAPLRKLQQEMGISSPSSAGPIRIPSRTNSPFRANSPAPLHLGVPVRTASPAPRSPVPSLGRSRTVTETTSTAKVVQVVASSSVTAPPNATPMVERSVSEAAPVVAPITSSLPRSSAVEASSSAQPMSPGRQLPPALLERVKETLLKGSQMYKHKQAPVETKTTALPTKEELARSVAHIQLPPPRDNSPKPLPKDKLDEIKAQLLNRDKDVAAQRQLFLSKVVGKRDQDKPLEEKIAMSVKKFATTEKDKMQQKKQALEKKEKEKKIKELLSFSQEFESKYARLKKKEEEESKRNEKSEASRDTDSTKLSTMSSQPASGGTSSTSTAPGHNQHPSSTAGLTRAQKQAAKLPPLKESSKESQPSPAVTPTPTKFKFNIKASEFKPSDFKPNPTAQPFTPRKESTYNPFFGDRQLKKGKISIRKMFPEMVSGDGEASDTPPTWDFGDAPYRSKYQVTNYMEEQDMYHQAMMAHQFNFPFQVGPGGFRYPAPFMAPGMPQMAMPMQPGMSFMAPTGVPHFSPQVVQGVPPTFGSPQVQHMMRPMSQHGPSSQNSGMNNSGDVSEAQSPQQAAQPPPHQPNQSPFIQPRAQNGGPPPMMQPGMMMMPGGPMQPPMYPFQPGAHMAMIPGAHMMQYPIGPNGVPMQPTMMPAGPILMQPGMPGQPMMMQHPGMFGMPGIPPHAAMMMAPVMQHNPSTSGDGSERGS